VGYSVHEGRNVARALDAIAERRRTELAQAKRYDDLQVKYFSDDSNDQIKGFLDQVKSNKSNKSAEEVVENFSNKVLDLYKTIDGNYRLLEDAFHVYVDLVDQHAGQVKRQAGQHVVFGSTKKMLTELYAIQQKHYELDGDDNQESLAVASLQYAILKFSEDSARLGLFSLLVDNWQSSSEVSKHFSVLAPLEQYTKTDFKFKDAELISKYYPEGLEKLQSTRTFYKNFYLAVKDLASDDLKSAAYKFSRLGEDEAKMKGIDFLAILKSRKDQNAKQKQEIVQNMLKEYTLAKQLLGQVHGVKTAWNEGDLACAMVLYKTSAYDAVKDQYPDVDSVEQLYTLLEELSPSLAPVEQVIKQHVAVRKDDKRIYVNCKSLGMEFSHQREDKSSEK
jgi:hypothetical protein